MSEPYLNKKMFKYVEVNAKFTIRYFLVVSSLNIFKYDFCRANVLYTTKYYELKNVLKIFQTKHKQAAKESLTCSTHLDFSPIKANLGVKAAAVKKWILTTAAQQPVYYESRGQAINASLELTS